MNQSKSPCRQVDWEKVWSLMGQTLFYLGNPTPQALALALDLLHQAVGEIAGNTRTDHKEGTWLNPKLVLPWHRRRRYILRKPKSRRRQ